MDRNSTQRDYSFPKRNTPRFDIGSKVKFDDLRGKITGFAIVSDSTEKLALVKLDIGFWGSYKDSQNRERQVYTSIMVVHPQNLELDTDWFENE